MNTSTTILVQYDLSSEYKIYGEVDIFQMYAVLQELIDKMTWPPTGKR